MRLLGFRGSLREWLCTCAMACAIGCAVASPDGERRAGDALSMLLPAGVLGAELWRGDRDGVRQFGLSFVVTVSATEILKRTTGVEQPDHTNDESFPSGHAARAFAAATYVHRRHGVDAALPLYALAIWVGYTRVQSQRHRWVDVAGAAAVVAASTWLFVQPQPLGVGSAHGRVGIWWTIPLR